MANEGNIRAAWAAVKAEVDALGVLMEVAEDAKDPYSERFANQLIVGRLPELVDKLAELEVQLDLQ